MGIQYFDQNIMGLTPETANVYEEISKLDCLKGLVLCGGTAISLQIGHRLSEDLDFELLSKNKLTEELNYSQIINEVCDKFPRTQKEILGDDHFLLTLPNNVKLSFFKPQNKVPSLNLTYKHNNVVAPSLQDMLGMKVFTLSLRSVFRDYYDIYALIKEGCDLGLAIKYACDFSRHTLHTKNILTCLRAYKLYQKESDFDERMTPKYKIQPEEIYHFLEEKFSLLNNIQAPCTKIKQR